MLLKLIETQQHFDIFYILFNSLHFFVFKMYSNGNFIKRFNLEDWMTFHYHFTVLVYFCSFYSFTFYSCYYIWAVWIPNTTSFLQLPRILPGCWEVEPLCNTNCASVEAPKSNQQNTKWVKVQIYLLTTSVLPWNIIYYTYTIWFDLKQSVIAHD